MTAAANTSTARPSPKAGRTSPLILILDVGSSSTRCLAFDSAGNPLRGVLAQRNHRPRLSPDGGVELDAPALLEECLDCLEAVAAQLRALGRESLGVGLCTYWHAFLGVDRRSRPVTPIYMWNDMRSANSAMTLRDQLDGRAYHARTGCVLHPSYLPARLHWLRQSDPRRYERCARFLSFGEYLELYLFGETRCGLSMASGTGLLDQTRGDWDAEMLDLLELPWDALAPLEKAPTARAGFTRRAASRLSALKSTPFFAAIGDGAASNLGLGATTEVYAALMIATGAAMRTFHSEGLPEAPEGLWRYQLDSRRALVGGALSNGSNLVRWLRGTLRLPARRTLETTLMDMPPTAHGLRVLPYLHGERNPDYPLDATGLIAGLRGSTTPLQIYQAGMEAVAYRLLAIWERLQPHRPYMRGFIAGGLLRSRVWARLLADVLGQPLHISKVAESSSRGTALFALEALGLLPDAHLLPPPLDMTIEPDPARHAVYQEAYAAHLEMHELLN